MPKYTVHLHRPRPDFTSVEVEADDEESAGLVALERVRQRGRDIDIHWEESDWAGEPEVTEVEEGWDSEV